MNTQIPLPELHAGDVNVRKTGGMSIDDLAASIIAHGLMHNLTVIRSTATDTDGRGYTVVAGGRRLRALQSLGAAGTLPTDLQAGIPCRVIEPSAAHEASLAENVIREGMHPADEFDAFNVMAERGDNTGEIAARFGKPEIYVKQRLKLASVAPDILAEYRAGGATLEQMMALALTDDQALQLRIWKSARNEWMREPDRLRNMITERETSSTSRLAMFVGLDAYETAGGSVRRDLFAAEAFLQDLALLDQLALAKLERTAAKVQKKEGWLWAEARTEFDYSDERAFSRVYPAHKGQKEIWPDDVKATAGAVVTIGYNGNAEIKRGFVRPQDRAAAATAAGDGEVKGKKLNVPGELSFAAAQRLQADVTGILRAEIASMPRTALALLAAELAGRVFYDHSDYGTAQRQWIHIQREHSGRMPGNLRDVIPQSKAGQALEAMETMWSELLPKKKADLREFLLSQDLDKVTRLLAFLAARELDLVDASADSKQGVVDAAAAVKVDLSKGWMPSEEWLATLPKAVVIGMVTEAAGAAAAAPLAKLKKDQLPHAAIDLLPKGWLPKPLRAPKKRKAKMPRAGADA